MQLETVAATELQMEDTHRGSDKKTGAIQLWTLSNFGARVRFMLTDPVDLLRHHGVQVTAQRLAVLRAVSAHPHITADGVTERARGEIGAISRQSVYDALTVLVEKGILRRIQPIGSPALFEDRVGDNHHHLICRGCGALADVDCAVHETPCLTASDDHGFVIDEAEVTYWGRCPACVAAVTSAHGSPRSSQHTNTTPQEETQ
jgi:Fur family ferric uptake transcriptional regulator